MKSNLFIKFFVFSLIVVFLYSCGTMSNGAFEKRKHLKGWHFKKNRTFSGGFNTHSLREQKESKKLDVTSDLSISAINAISEKELLKLKQPENTHLLMSEEVQPIIKRFPSDFLVDTDETVSFSESVLTSSSLIQSSKTNQKLTSKEISSTVESENEERPSPIQIFFQSLLLIACYGLLILAVFMLSFIIGYSSIVLSLIILVPGVLLCLTFLDRSIKRLKSEPDEKKEWTFFRSLKRVIIFVSIAAFVIFTINYLSSLKNYG